MTSHNHKPGRRMRTRLGGATLAAVLLVGAGACGDDGESLSADEKRYCELTGELDAKGEAAFADVSEDASAEELTAAEKKFVESADAELTELAEVAPAEIDDEVAAYVAGFRARAEGKDSNVSDEPLVEWEEENCPDA